MTRSQTVAQLGRQSPRLLHRPKWDSEDDGVDAIEFAGLCGLVLDLWQQLLVRIILATLRGRWAASEIGFLVARQNGKGGVLEAIALWSLFCDDGTTVWTAHQLKTSDESYERVCSLIRSNPDLASRVLMWDGGLTGQHILKLKPEYGSTQLVFVARSRSSVRGFSPKRIICDEAQELGVLALRALMYAKSAQRGAQMIYTGTVPDESNDAAVWTGVRDRGRARKSTRLAWAEWTPLGSEVMGAVINPADPTNQAYANPALGIRIEHETVAGELETAESVNDVDGFLKERLSVWASRNLTGSGVLNVDAWDRGKTKPFKPYTGRVALVVEVTQDRLHSLIGLVGPTDAGIQVELTSAVRGGKAGPQAGTGWVADRVAEVAAGNSEIGWVVVDSMGHAGSLVPALASALSAAWDGETAPDHPMPEVREVNGPEFVDACGLTFDAIQAGAVLHGGGKVMRAAVLAAVKRERPGLWIWDRRAGGLPMAPLLVLTLGISVLTGVDKYDPMDGIAF